MRCAKSFRPRGPAAALTATLTLAMSLALTLAVFIAPAPVSALSKPGAMMPPLTLPDAQGQSISLPELTQGKVTLLVYWSISCPHCREQMPKLQALAKRFQGNPFLFLLVNTDGQAMASAVSAYAAEHRLPGPIVLDVGPKDTLPLADFFDIVATPGVLVFDKTGKLVMAQELQVNMDQVSQAIESSF
jgi:cytochrome c biogenesis protein CcmG, thiol:disulfide interchange protein DsbE